MTELGKKLFYHLLEQSYAEQESTLRQFHKHLSEPQPSFREGDFTGCYPQIVLSPEIISNPTMVLDTDKPNVKKVKMFDNDDDYHQTVLLDEKGRPVRISEPRYETEFKYDDAGYLTEASRTQGRGYGWVRRFTYREVAGEKQLAKLEIQSYYAAGSTNQPMQRGEPGRMTVVNFGLTGRPDNLVALVDA